MHTVFESGATATPPTRDRGAAAPAIRTYQQIAEILATREGLQITPARVRQICQEAELKILNAFVDEPFQQQIRAMLAELERAPSIAADVAERYQAEGRRLVLTLLADAAISRRARSGFRWQPQDEESEHDGVETVVFGWYSNVFGPGLGSES